MIHSSFLAPIITNALLYYAICPVLISVFSSNTKLVIKTNTAIFLLTQVCSNITYQPLVEAIVQIIFLPYQQKELLNLINNYPTDFLQYNSVWTSPSNSILRTLADCILISHIRCTSIL